MLSNTEKSELIDVANALADAAREVTLRFFRSSTLVTDNKDNDGFDPVTIADRETERVIRDILKSNRPDDAILGEEFEDIKGSTGITWVIDPIDGTRAFISGVPTWGVLIAANTGNGPVLGVIDQPYTGERFIGAFGEAQLISNNVSQDISTKASGDIADATLFTTYPEVGSDFEREGFEAVSRKVKLTRYGIDCYAYALLAMGQIDLVIEAELNAYDVQGPQGVIESAGGLFTNWQGGPAHMGGRILAAANAEIHAQALEILSKVPENN